MKFYYKKLNTILKSDSEVEACKEQVKEILKKWNFKKNNNQKISYGEMGRKIEASQIMIEYGTDYVNNSNSFIHTLTSMRGVDASLNHSSSFIRGRDMKKYYKKKKLVAPFGVGAIFRLRR